MHYISHYQSPIGELTLGSDGESLIGLWTEGQKYFGNVLSDTAIEKDLPIFRSAAAWLDSYFGGTIPGTFPALRMIGSDFRTLVWRILLTIPYGHTISYGQVAAEAAKQMQRDRMSSQAVGGAVSHNAILIMIPCHRVVGADHRLVGYAGGCEKKKWLLEFERKHFMNP